MVVITKPITVEEFDSKQDDRDRNDASSVIIKINQSLRAGNLYASWNGPLESAQVMKIVFKHLKAAEWAGVDQKAEGSRCTFTVERMDGEEPLEEEVKIDSLGPIWLKTSETLPFCPVCFKKGFRNEMKREVGNVESLFIWHCPNFRCNYTC